METASPHSKQDVSENQNDAAVFCFLVPGAREQFQAVPENLLLFTIIET